jgi:hypothetical protein
MPNYNQTLQTNNSSLEEIITQLNNLPDAGGDDSNLSTIYIGTKVPAQGFGKDGDIFILR